MPEVELSLAPMLSVRDGARAVQFYRSAFDAEEVFRIESPDGAIVCKLSVGASEFWVADESPEHSNFSPQTIGGATTRMVITTPDPDKMFARALAAGGTQVLPVEDQEYGWRVGRVLDPFGHHWELGRPLEP